MKYFINASERAASGHENYIEFQKAGSAADFWDEESLYMSEAVMEDSGFGTFLSDCMAKHDFMDAIYAEYWTIMVEDAKGIGGAVWEVINELSPWLEAQYAAGADRVELVSASDRALERRRQQRKAYPVDPKFYEEVRAIDESLPFAQSQAAYEKLLRKYNMPSCFFPFPLYEPDEWL